MNIVMVVPTYWSRPLPEAWRRGDAVYDHATPLATEGTLARTIESIATIRDNNFELVVLACATTPDIAAAVPEHVASIIAKSRTSVPTVLFSHAHLAKLIAALPVREKTAYAPLLSLFGYSQIRNMCLVAAHLRAADVAVLIDDDEVFEDPDFITKVREGIRARGADGKRMLGIAGYYMEVQGDHRTFIRNRDIPAWMAEWNKFAAQNAAFQTIIGEREPRYKITPFAFGGNMVIAKDLFMRVPFDPEVSRGEDMDYCMNAKMFDVDFYLDNQLAITHLPPPRSHPMWRRVREDAVRYMYQREKIRRQKPLSGMRMIRAEDLDPYPGLFLKDDLDRRIRVSQTMLAETYRKEGKEKDAEEALRTIDYTRAVLENDTDPFQKLVDTQIAWTRMMHDCSVLDREELFSKIS